MEKLKQKEKYFKISFVLLIFIFCFICTMKEPYGIGPDEQMKMDVCKYIQENNVIPHGGDEAIRNPDWGISYAFTPILSYIISAMFMKIVAIFTANEFALVVAARFVSVLCYTGIAIMSIKIAEKLFKGIYKWVFIVLITCLPQLIFIGSYINNDSLAIFSISIIIYSWIIGLETKWNMKSNIILGVGLGMCALSYYNAYGFILTSTIIFIVSYFINKENNKIDIKKLFKNGIIIFAVTFLICGWWFIRSYIIYDGDFLGLNITEEYAEKYAKEGCKPSNRRTPQNLNQSMATMILKREWLQYTIKSFIGFFGPLTMPIGTKAYIAYIAIYFIGFAGYLVYLIKNIKLKFYKKEKNKLLLEIIFIINMIIPVCLSLYYSYTNDFQPQGRYIMPMLIPLMYFVTVGIKELSERFIKNDRVKNIIFVLFIISLYIIPILYIKNIWS